MSTKHEVIVHSGHRGLRYVDGRLDEVLEPGHYRLPRRRRFGRRVPRVTVTPIDVRERELNIKGQEILTADKVAVRVNIITHFRVVDPEAAVGQVADYEDRIYSDVQLAARRSLASMTLEAILTNRNQLSEDILRDVEGISAGYGVRIIRADVKDLVFPGNLQEVMNRVLTAQRVAEAQMVEARTRAEREALEANTKATTARLAAEADAEAQRIRADAEVDALRRLAAAAEAYAQHPALLRLRELETLGALGRNAEARLYIGFDKHSDRVTTE